MIYRSKRFFVSVSPLFIMLTVTVLFTKFCIYYLLVISSLLLHEMGHVLIARGMGIRILSLHVIPIGMYVVVESNTKSWIQEIVIDISGPIVNLLLALLLVWLYEGKILSATLSSFFILTNISLAVFNMLPILPLDGGRILNHFLTQRMGIFEAMKCMKMVTFPILILIVMLGFFQFQTHHLNLSLVVVGVYLFVYFKEEERTLNMMNIKQIVFRRSRLLKKSVYAGRSLVVLKSAKLGDVIKHMDFDRFHIIYVLDEEQRIIRMISEQEIIDAMILEGGDITIEMLICEK